MPRQTSLECSFEMTRINPMAGACPTALGCEIASDRLGAARHEIETQLGAGAVGFERLREMEQRVQIAGHALVIDLRVEIPKIDDALRRVLLARFDQFLPVLERFRPQGEGIGSIELEIRLLRRATRQRTPVSRSREINASPSPEASANTSHDFSSGASTAVSTGAAVFLSGLPREQADLAFAAVGPIRPGNEIVSLKPVSRSTISHCARSSSGCSGRRSRSVKRHQPLVSPKTVSVQSCGVAVSMKIRLPPGASRSCRFRNAARTSLTACKTLVPMMKSNEAASSSCSTPGFSRSKILNSTSGKAASFCCAAEKNAAETSVKV